MASSETTLSILVQLKDQASEKLKGFQGNLQKLQPEINQLALASGVAFAGMTAAIGLSVAAAAEAETKIASLGATLDAMGGNMLGVKESILAASKSFVQLGFDDETAAQSMGILFQRTGDITQAMKLTSLAADLARAKHLDLESATKLVSLALSGQGRALMQYGIIIKDSATPLEALGILQEKVGGQSRAFADTFTGKMAQLKGSVDNLREAIGDVFLPILKKFVDLITPVVNAITDFVNHQQTLTATILVSTTVILGFTTLALGLLAVFIKLKPAIAMANEILIKFGLTLGAIAAPVAIIVAAMLAITYATDKWKSKIQDTIDANLEYSGKLNALQKSLEELKKPIEQDTAALKDMADKMEAANKKITDLQKTITKTIQENADKQVSYNEDKAKIFVDQEQKVADLKKQITEKTAELQKSMLDESSADKIQSTQQELADLQNKLSTEQTDLNSFQLYATDIQAQLTEMRRRAGETEFQNKIETLMRARILELKAQKEKLEQFILDLKDAQSQKDALIKIEQEYYAKLAQMEADHLQKIKDTTVQIISLMLQRNAAMQSAPTTFNQTTVKFSPSGTPAPSTPSPYNSDPLRYINDAIITPKGDVITDPADYLIATKNPGGLGGGVTVNVYGDVTGEELIERVKQGLMRSLRLDTKFAI